MNERENERMDIKTEGPTVNDGLRPHRSHRVQKATRPAPRGQQAAGQDTATRHGNPPGHPGARFLAKRSQSSPGRVLKELLFGCDKNIITQSGLQGAAPRD